MKKKKFMLQGNLSYEAINCGSYGNALFPTGKINICRTGIRCKLIFWMKKSLRRQVCIQGDIFFPCARSLQNFLIYYRNYTKRHLSMDNFPKSRSVIRISFEQVDQNGCVNRNHIFSRMDL